MNKKILYIGNNLSKKTNYITTMDTLSGLLKEEGYTIFKSSSKTNKVLRLIEMCFAVIYYCRSIDYLLIDTFSTTNFYYALFTSQLARIFNLKYIPILHGGNLPKRLDKSPILSQIIFKNSYYNIAPSNYLKVEFEKRGYHVKFIPNVLEIENYTYKSRKKIEPKLLWVRAFKDIYNPTLAIKVLSELKKEYPSSKLCMIGPIIDENIHNKVLSLIKRFNLEKDIEITGVLPKDVWHKKSEEYDIIINTTNVDNTPVSLLEAMALGLTIVSTNVGGIPFLIKDNVEGVLVEKDNAILMKNEIIRVLKSNNDSLNINAYKKVKTFSWEKVREKWFEILK